MFPEEMWAEILKHVDVLDLVRLRTVSKQFLYTIDRVIKRESKWYEKCLKEIPKKYWTSILEHHTNPELSGCDFENSKRHSPIWIAKYKSWIDWKDFIDEMKREPIIDFPGTIQKITSVSESSNINSIGFCDRDPSHGHVDVYDINQLNNGPLYVGREPVMDVQVWRKDNDLKVTSYCDRVIKHWTIVPLLGSPQRKGSSSIFTKISANLGYCYTLVDGFQMGNYRCSPMIERLSDMDSRMICWRKPDRSRLFDIVADGDKVTFLSIDRINSRVLKINEITSESGELTNISKIPCPDWMKSSRIFKPCVVFYLTDEGEICIVYVKDADQLENLNMETMRYKILKLDESPITDIAVTEYNSTQYIVATTLQPRFNGQRWDRLRIAPCSI